MAKIVKTKKEKTNKKLAIFSITVFVIVSLLGITSSVVLNTYKVNIMKSIQSTEFRIDELKLENQRITMRIQELKNEVTDKVLATGEFTRDLNSVIYISSETEWHGKKEKGVFLHPPPFYQFFNISLATGPSKKKLTANTIIIDIEILFAGINLWISNAKWFIIAIDTKYRKPKKLIKQLYFFITFIN